jgi:biotin transport system substrate-specific component
MTESKKVKWSVINMMESNLKAKTTTKDIVYISLATALMAICSWISIPLIVPVTLQTFAVFTAVGLLGLKRGTLAVLVYILLGALGVPVFAGFTGGFGILIGSTGGYIIGFIFSALVVGLITKFFGKKTPMIILSMIAGLLVCYLFGTSWFMYVYAKNTGAVGLSTVLSWCVIPFIIPDAAKIALATIVVNRVSKHVKY